MLVLVQYRLVGLRRSWFVLYKLSAQRGRQNHVARVVGSTHDEPGLFHFFADRWSRNAEQAKHVNRHENSLLARGEMLGKVGVARMELECCEPFPEHRVLTD